MRGDVPTLPENRRRADGIRRRFPTYGGYFSSSGKFKPIDASWTTLPDLRLRLWQLSERLAEIR